MKVKASVQAMCPQCRLVKRRGILRVICTNSSKAGRHKQRQG